MKTITENSSISIGLVIALTGALLAWGRLSSSTEANARAIDTVSNQQRAYNETVQKINERLSNIEGYLRARDRSR